MIHPSAIVDIVVDPSTNIWAFAHVLSGATIGRRVNIGDHAFIEGGALIGDNVTIKNAVCVWQGITIEDDVFVGPNVTFTNDRYPRSPRTATAKERYSVTENWLVPTRVCRGCSIGAAAVICPGVVLGAYSMVAAGAVVTRDVAPFTLVGGVPAKPMGHVCSCGQPLPGRDAKVKCTVCGECPHDRNLKLFDLKSQTRKPLNQQSM